MSEKKQLNEGQLEKVTGGDDYDELAKEAGKSAAEIEQAKLQKQLEDLENNQNQRNSTELNDLVNNMLDMLKKLNGEDDDSDGQIHIG